MDRYLLDSDAVIDYLKGIASSVDLINDIHRRGGILCVCDIVIAEVYTGVRPQDQERTARILQSYHFLPTLEEMARQAGEWRYTYARRGLTISTTDAIIAATAYGHLATVITGNTRDYPMPEVKLLQLPRATR